MKYLPINQKLKFAKQHLKMVLIIVKIPFTNEHYKEKKSWFAFSFHALRKAF